jgi:hypothetical protein
VVALVIIGLGQLIVNARLAVPVPLEFVAPILAVYVPERVGVPVMAPVPELIPIPGGKPAAE